MTGEAFAMRVQLAKLMQRHGVAPKPFSIPLSDPAPGPLTLSGLAATSDVDFGRQKFKPYCFNNPCLLLKGYPFPKLCLKHDTSKAIGTITSLKYDDRGQLRIVADVADERAKRLGAFSVGAKVIDYELVDPDSPDFYALITKAEIVEISLTDVPANASALVQNRYPTPPFAAYAKACGAQSELFSRAVGLLLKQVEAIAVLASTPAPAKHDLYRNRPYERAPRPPLAREPHRATPFGQLIRQIEERADV